MSNSSTLADLFAEARTLLEGKTVADVFVMRPDPAYDALRKVVEVQRYPISLIAEIYWEQAPDGALEGALIKAMGDYIQKTYSVDEDTADALWDALRYSRLIALTNDALWDALTDLTRLPGDTRIPAMQAMVEWLRGQV